MAAATEQGTTSPTTNSRDDVHDIQSDTHQNDTTNSHDNVHDIQPDTHQDDTINLVDSDAISVDSFMPVMPVYVIDLSLPPEQRYVQVATDLKSVIQCLPELFDELLEEANLPKRLFHFIARLVLRKLYHKEEMDELKGIGKVTGVPMYLLVAYNVLSDLFMGCTSGGILVKEPGNKKGKKTRGTMMHFRTLDWTMPELANALVQFDFVEREGGDVIASSIGYAGFVGIVTGVRKGLSVSLNFRPYHNNDESKRANLKFYSHLALVMLGLRPCIAAHLRDLILPRTTPNPQERNKDAEKNSSVSPTRSILTRPKHTLSRIARDFPSIPTTAGYIVVCNSRKVLILEKDRVAAHIIYDRHLAVVTNHDRFYEHLSMSHPQASRAVHAKKSHLDMDMEDILRGSMNRKTDLTDNWWEKCKKNIRKSKGGTWGNEEGVRLDELKGWLTQWPIMNHITHFVAVMDPREGVFKWVRWCKEDEWETDDESDVWTEA